MDRIVIKTTPSGFTPVFGKGDTCPIDQMPARDFNIDPYTGRPLEEITKVMRAQTAAEQQTAFMNLVQYKGDFLPDETSAKTALKFMKPSLCQLPSELAEWSEAVAEYQYKEQRSELEKKEKEELLKQAEEDAKKVVQTPASVEQNAE